MVRCRRPGVGPGDINLPEVHGGLPVGDPIGQRPPDPGGGHHANRIHSRRDKEIIHIGGLAHQRPRIMGETFRAVHEMLNARIVQGRTQSQRRFHKGRELLPNLRGSSRKGRSPSGPKASQHLASGSNPPMTSFPASPLM